MILHTNYTDSYGLTHANPVFVINYASMNITSQQGINFDRTTMTHATSSNNTIRISYGVIYWTSDQARLDGLRPMDYISPSGEQQISFTLESEPTDLKAACEAHFSENHLGI